MAAWLIPALKLVLPHVGTIFSAAAPVFTKKKVEEADSQAAEEGGERGEDGYPMRRHQLAARLAFHGAAGAEGGLARKAHCGAIAVRAVDHRRRLPSRRKEYNAEAKGSAHARQPRTCRVQEDPGVNLVKAE